MLFSKVLIKTLYKRTAHKAHKQSGKQRNKDMYSEVQIAFHLREALKNEDVCFMVGSVSITLK